MHSGTSLVHTLQKMDHLRPSISLLLQLSVLPVYHRLLMDLCFDDVFGQNANQGYAQEPF